MVTWIKADFSREQKRFVKVDPIKESSPAQNDGDIQMAILNIFGWDRAIWNAANPPWLEPKKLRLSYVNSSLTSYQQLLYA